MRRFVFVLLLGVLACGGSSDSTTAPTTGSLAGTWNLQTVNGNALPYTQTLSGVSYQIVSGQAVLTAGGTWTSSLEIRATVSGQTFTTTETDAGTFTVSGSNVSLKSNSDNSVTTGTVSGNSFSIAVEGAQYVFRKQ